MLRRCILFIFYSILGLASPIVLIAQSEERAIQDSLKPSILEASELYTPLLYTDNTAALWSLPLTQLGQSQATFQSTRSNFRRPQEAHANQALHLITERYQRSNQALWYGKFAFAQGRDKEINWSSMLNPYRGTPYILADSIGGDWKKQHYTLEAKVASRPIWKERLHVGFNLRYELATGAKQIDPRPLSNTNTLTLGPSLLWHVNNQHQLGLSTQYQSFREYINIEIRQPNTSHNLYRFKGLTIHDHPIPTTSGHSRRYNGNELTGALQHQVNFNSIITLSSAVGYAQYDESTIDGSATPVPSGDYTRKKMYITSSLSKRSEDGRRLKQIVLNAARQNNTGTEYHTTYDHTLGQSAITFSGTLYKQEKQTLSLRYNQGYFTSIGDLGSLFYLDLAIDQMETNYLYTQPSKQDILQFRYAVGYWHNIPGKWRLQSELGYQHSPIQSLHYTPKAGANTAAKEILYPDHDYLTASSAHLTLQGKRIFKFSESRQTQWYAHSKVHYKQRLDKATNSLYGLNHFTFQIGFGAYY